MVPVLLLVGLFLRWTAVGGNRRINRRGKAIIRTVIEFASECVRESEARSPRLRFSRDRRWAD